VLPPQPPYSLPVPEFRFRALASLAGRAPLGGEREVALGALMAARLAAGTTGSWPPAIPTSVRVKRAGAARGWFSSLAVQPAVRAHLLRVVDASASEDSAALADALQALVAGAAQYLDGASTRELRQLAEAVGGSVARDGDGVSLPAPRPIRRAEQPA
jgi:hypothetical protein